MKRMFIYLAGLFLLLVGNSLPMLADDDFDPANPAEPNLFFNVSVTCYPEGCAYVSGGGRRQTGTTINVSASARSTNYTFNHWEKNGEVYDTGGATSFSYTTEEMTVRFVAFFDYTPVNPAEPIAINEYRLFLTCTPEGACSFNRTSGAKVSLDSWNTVVAYANNGYVFDGWYQGSTQVSTSLSFNYYMDDTENVTLTARFTYSPTNPGEPDLDLTALYEQLGLTLSNKALGDVNGDGVIDVTDAVQIINNYLHNTDVDKSVFDVNKDGTVDATDAVQVVNRYLNNTNQ